MADSAEVSQGSAASGNGPAAGRAQPDTAPTQVQPGSVPDVAARLDAQRGWLAELERIVSIRTRVGLVLLALAFGAAAAAAYLAIDTREDSASEDDLRQVRSELEQSAAGAASAAEVEALRGQVRAAQAQLRSVQAELDRRGAGGGGAGATGGGAGAGGGGAGAAMPGNSP
jgi:hypothetical protein